MMRALQEKLVALAEILIVAFFIFILFLLVSCKHKPLSTDNPDDLANDNGQTSIPFPGNGIACQPGKVYFYNDILPLFVSKCAMSGCHDNGTASDGVILTSYQSIMSRNKIVPFNPNNGKIMKAINESDPDKIMPRPPHEPLTASQKNLIVQWINQGALENACEKCDTNSVTYNGYVKPIIENKCKGCHTGLVPAYSVPLITNYNQVRDLAISSMLYGVISHSPGYRYMPKYGPKLPDCEIAGIKKWIDAGAPNN